MTEEKTYRVRVISYRNKNGKDVESPWAAETANLLFLDGDKEGTQQMFSVAFARGLDLMIGDEVDYSIEE
jgi:hypothetical protein